MEATAGTLTLGAVRRNSLSAAQPLPEQARPLEFAPSVGSRGSSSHECGSERHRELRRVRRGDVAVVSVGNRVVDYGRTLAFEAEETARADVPDAQTLRRGGH